MELASHTTGHRRTRAGRPEADAGTGTGAEAGVGSGVGTGDVFVPAPAAGPGDDDEDDFRDPSPLTMPPVSRAKQASVLAASFGAICLTIGYNQSYGVFQQYYLSAQQDVLDLSHQEPPTALLAFVGTLGAGLTWVSSIGLNPFLSRIEHRAYLRTQDGRNTSGSSSSNSRLLTAFRPSTRTITLAGVALMAVGFLLASVASQVWQLLLTQGLLYGIGSSMLYFPLLSPAPEYFSRHRGTALGLILAGGGVGSVVLTQFLRALLPAIGGRWTLRALAALYVVVGTPVAWAVPASRFPVVPGESGSESGPPLRRRTRLSPSLMTTPAFLSSVLTAFCQAAGAALPVTFIPSYSVALGLSASTGATLLAVSNVVNAAARVATGFVGDRFGRLNVLVLTLAGSFVAVVTLWGLSVKAGETGTGTNNNEGRRGALQLWFAFIAVYSFAAGGYNSLFPATIADVFGIRSYAAVVGFLYFVRGCGTMVGSPVGGLLLGSGSSSSSHSKSSSAYTSVVVWDSALLAVSVVGIVAMRWADAVRRGWSWRA